MPDHCWIHSKADGRRRQPGPRANRAMPYVSTQPASPREKCHSSESTRKISLWTRHRSRRDGLTDDLRAGIAPTGVAIGSPGLAERCAELASGRTCRSARGLAGHKSLRCYRCDYVRAKNFGSYNLYRMCRRKLEVIPGLDFSGSTKYIRRCEQCG